MMSEGSELQPQEELEGKDLEGEKELELEGMTLDPAEKVEQTGDYREAEEIEAALRGAVDSMTLEQEQAGFARIPGMEGEEQINLNDPPQEAEAQAEPSESGPSEDPEPLVTPINIPYTPKPLNDPSTITENAEVKGIKISKEGEEQEIPGEKHEESEDPLAPEESDGSQSLRA